MNTRIVPASNACRRRRPVSPSPPLTPVIAAATPIAGPTATRRTSAQPDTSTRSRHPIDELDRSMTTFHSTPITPPLYPFWPTPRWPSLVFQPKAAGQKAKAGHGVHPRMVSYPTPHGTGASHLFQGDLFRSSLCSVPARTRSSASRGVLRRRSSGALWAVNWACWFSRRWRRCRGSWPRLPLGWPSVLLLSP